MNGLSWYCCPTKIHLGVGAHEKIEDVVHELGCTRLFVAADEALLKSELFVRISALLRRSGVSATRGFGKVVER